MSFSYNNCDGSNDQIDFVRALISDTNPNNYIWQDSEIQGFYRLQGLQSQSSMQYEGSMYINLPSNPVSTLRVAALLLDSMAVNQAKLAQVIELLDVKLSADKAAAMLHAQAESLRDVDDNSGAFAIIEQCTTVWGFQQRYWNSIQRQGI